MRLYAAMWRSIVSRPPFKGPARKTYSQELWQPAGRNTAVLPILSCVSRHFKLSVCTVYTLCGEKSVGMCESKNETCTEPNHSVQVLFYSEFSVKNRSQRKGGFCYFSSLEYPSPYCTHRETRLKVAEEISAWAMTWL